MVSFSISRASRAAPRESSQTERPHNPPAAQRTRSVFPDSKSSSSAAPRSQSLSTLTVPMFSRVNALNRGPREWMSGSVSPDSICSDSTINLSPGSDGSPIKSCDSISPRECSSVPQCVAKGRVDGQRSTTAPASSQSIPSALEPRETKEEKAGISFLRPIDTFKGVARALACMVGACRCPTCASVAKHGFTAPTLFDADAFPSPRLADYNDRATQVLSHPLEAQILALSSLLQDRCGVQLISDGILVAALALIRRAVSIRKPDGSCVLPLTLVNWKALWFTAVLQALKLQLDTITVRNGDLCRLLPIFRTAQVNGFELDFGLAMNFQLFVPLQDALQAEEMICAHAHA